MALACPACHTPLREDAFACFACYLAVRVAGGLATPVYPEIRPSAPLYAVDLRHEPLTSLDADRLAKTGVVRCQACPEGLAIELQASKGFEWTAPFMSLRDGCVRLRIASATGRSRVMLVARSRAIGTFRKYYGLLLDVDRREVSLVRMMAGNLGQKGTVFQPLTAWTGHETLRALGPQSILELRVQGPMLEGCVDGRRVVVTHDPYLGIGSLGVRVEATTEPARLVLSSLEIAGVVA